MMARVSTQRRRTAAAVARLADELGAEVMIRAEPRPPMRPSERIRARASASTHTQVRWPTTAGSARVLVVYDFMLGPERDVWRTHGAKLIRQALVQAGAEIARCAFATMWDCERDDMPKVSKADVAEAASRLGEVVRAADTDRVLLLGGNAGQAWHPQVDLTRMWGRTALWPGVGQVFVRPVMHPGAVLRDILPAAEWRRQVAGFMLEADENIGLTVLSKRCVVCDATGVVYDRCGVSHCRDHADKVAEGFNRRATGRKQAETLSLEAS